MTRTPKIFKIFGLLLLMITQSGLAQESYYANNKKINLERRSDKIAIIMEENYPVSEAGRNMIADLLLLSGDNIVTASEQIYLINSPSHDIFNSGMESVISSRLTGLKFVTPVYYGQSRMVSQIPTDEFIVRLNSPDDKEFLDIFNARNNVRIMGNVGDERGFLLKSNAGVRLNALELSSLYHSTGKFQYAEPNFAYPEHCLLNSIPNDPLFPRQWSLHNVGQSVTTGSTTFGDQSSVTGIPGSDIDAVRAWDVTLGSQLIKIGFLDTGIDSTHPDLRPGGRILPGYDAVYNKYGVPKDSGNFGGHGTCVAGLIGAARNNALGVAGVAPGCKIMAFRIFNKNGTSTSAGIARAFDTARVAGIDILNNSWNGFQESTTVTDAINNAALNGRGGLGCLIFFAAGNEGNRSPWYPAYLQNVIAVGASTFDDQKKSPGTGNQFTWGSNFGESPSGDLDLVAPTTCYTVDIQGAFGYTNIPGPDGDYFASFSGTSVSSPIVSGVAGLILSLNQSFSRTAVLDFLYRGCEKIDLADYSTDKAHGKWNSYYGYGRVNAYNSVKLATGIDITPPVISHKITASHSSTYPTSVIADISDQDGSPVPTSGDNRARLLYRTKKLNDPWSEYDSVFAVSVAGDEHKFVIPCQGFETQVQYYIRAFDNSGNSGTYPNEAPGENRICYFAIGQIQTQSRNIGTFICSDGGTATQSPTVDFDNFNITDASVRLYLRHSRMSDLVIQLYSPLSDPNINRKCIFAANGESGADISGALVSDSASAFWMDGLPPYTGGSFRPDFYFRGLQGSSALGSWSIINFDRFEGYSATYDSAIISLSGLSGIPSACLAVDRESDSVLSFGSIQFPDSVVKVLYIRNSGTADLILSNAEFAGVSQGNFSLENSLPGPIPPGDSAAISIKLKTVSALFRSATDNPVEDAVLELTTNDPSKQLHKISLQTETGVQNVRVVTLRMLLQGFYYAQGDTMTSDTVRLIMRNGEAPYAVIDSAISIQGNDGLGHFYFSNYSPSQSIIFQIRHRNSVETWTNILTPSFVNDTLHYDMTTAETQAYGGNLTRVNLFPQRFAIYGGDVTQDGIIDISDLMQIDNDAYSFASGYLPTDVNGDGFVDLTDAAIAGNNAENYVIRIVP